MYHKCFNLQYNKKGVLTGYSERKDIIEQKLELCGYFYIITSDEMTAASFSPSLMRWSFFTLILLLIKVVNPTEVHPTKWK